MGSDHGMQYTSGAFGAWRARNSIRQSMGETDQFWDNDIVALRRQFIDPIDQDICEAVGLLAFG